MSQNKTKRVTETRRQIIDKKLALVLDYADTNANFDPTFVESLFNQFMNTGDLTPTQVDALDTIISKWDIGAELDL
jgi:hypothetical protein